MAAVKVVPVIVTLSWSPAPRVPLNMSAPLPQSVMVSVSAATAPFKTKVSTPKPPVMLSLPAPPVIVSAPVPPIIVSLKSLPIRFIAVDPEPVTVKPLLPVAADKLTPKPAVVKFTVPSLMVAAVAV